MPKVSVIIPTIKPEYASLMVNSVTANANYDDYEIVIVSPFELEGDERVRWIREPEASSGATTASIAGFERTDSEIVVGIGDYTLTKRNWLCNLVEFIEQREKGAFPFCAGLFWANSNPETPPAVGTVFGHYYPYFYGMSRRSILAAGGYLLPEYPTAFGDCDLGLRVWELGGQCQLCWDSILISMWRKEMSAQRKANIGDHEGQMRTFIDRWKPVYGEGWPAETLRDFNIDIPVSFIPFDDMSLLPTIIKPPN